MEEREIVLSSFSVKTGETNQKISQRNSANQSFWIQIPNMLLD